MRSHLQGKNSTRWNRSLSNELGRISQDKVHEIGKTTLEFIHKKYVPQGRKPTYTSFVYDHIPLKKNNCKSDLL